MYQRILVSASFLWNDTNKDVLLNISKITGEIFFTPFISQHTLLYWLESLYRYIK